MSKFFRNLGIIAIFVAVVFAGVKIYINDLPENQVFAGSYVGFEKPAQLIRIIKKANVRSEPTAKSAADTSYGMIKVKDVAFEVSSTISIVQPIDRDTDFIGIHTGNIISMDDWEKVFPKRIMKDPDGIVWIDKNAIGIYS